MSQLSQLPYLVITKTGFFRYRRRVPHNIRAEIGLTEVVRSLHTRNPEKVHVRHAKAHSQVETLFAQARRKAGVSDDIIFEMAMQSLKAKGIANQNGSLAGLDRDDRSAAQDIVLAGAGFSSADELTEALEVYPKGKAPAKLQAVSTALGLLAGNKRRPTISYCLGQFLTDRARREDTTSRAWTRYEQQRKLIVSEFTKLVGDKDITDVTRPEARSFVVKLEKDGYKPSTVEKYAKFMGALTGWSLRELGLEGTNQFSRLQVATPVGHNDDGVSFTYDEVKLLLSETGSMNDELRDIIRLLACTGARLAEISGLAVRDVEGDGNILNIRFNDIRRLKNNQSIRTVPVVDQESVEALCSRTEGRNAHDPVFPRYGRDGGADAASAILSKWLTNIKLRDPKAKKPKTTHSLRHTYKDALRDVGVLRDIADMIQGHTAGDAASRYGSNDLLERKREGMGKVWKLLVPALPVPAAAVSSDDAGQHQEQL